jgi:hypothetical protein
MQSPMTSERRGALAVGLLLVAAGVAAFGARQAGFDPFEALGDNGWPLFVIVPGLVLLGASVVPPVPHGVGFAIAGSIVTIVGLVLLFRQVELVRVGLILCAIAAVMFTVGFWFFESVFESGRVPADLDRWWPVGLIGVGLVVLIGGFAGSSRRHPQA